jgi:hypothetical protein
MGNFQPSLVIVGPPPFGSELPELPPIRSLVNVQGPIRPATIGSKVLVTRVSAGPGGLYDFATIAHGA